jgi:D-tyrosyl-tRNA(Tyr) deacylase
VAWHDGAVRALVQRVESAAVESIVDGVSETVGEIGPGLAVLVGVTHTDDERVADKLADKIWNLRIMDDENGVMNLAVKDTSRAILVVSQFTLYGDTNSGRRPSWIAAARPEVAEPLVRRVVDTLRSLGADVATGRFRTTMKVSLVNDGPTTVMIEI